MDPFGSDWRAWRCAKRAEFGQLGPLGRGRSATVSSSTSAPGGETSGSQKPPRQPDKDKYTTFRCRMDAQQRRTLDRRRVRNLFHVHFQK